MGLYDDGKRISCFCESPELGAFVRGIKQRVLMSANRVITYELPSRKGGGGTLIFSYTRRLGSFFFFFFLGGGGVGGSYFEYKYLFFCGGFRKMKICSGMMILWIFWGVITKLDYI